MRSLFIRLAGYRLNRLAVGSLFSGAACVGLIAGSPAAAQSERCLASECFSDQQIRDFQIVDEDTLVIYVGRDRCAFMVTVDNLFCSLTYLPEVEFFETMDRRMEIRSGRRDPRDTGLTAAGDSYTRNDRVCVSTATRFSLESFGFASVEPDTLPRGRPACEVREVVAITDNDIVELLADQNIAPPPPPVGNGEISRREDREQRDD